MMPPEGSLPEPVSTRLAVARATEGFLTDALEGLSAAPKRLSPKYFYDRTGSLLFDAICELPEYYLTRTELSILRTRMREIVGKLGPRVRVIEPGAGSGTKTRLLLTALGPEHCTDYVPVEISREHLAVTARELQDELPWLRVTPVVADFTQDFPVPESNEATRKLVYFPGSTIGNFDPPDARRLLTRFRRAAGPGGLVLLGVDLRKDPALLHAAYNDAENVTAEFNKNVLRRMNVELGADFDLDAFRHYAFYEPVAGRIEMHLVSARRQTVHLGGHAFRFEDGESIRTEHSYKYDLPSAERLARDAGLSLVDAWLDDDRRFAVLLLRSRPAK